MNQESQGNAREKRTILAVTSVPLFRPTQARARERDEEIPLIPGHTKRSTKPQDEAPRM